MTGPFAEVRVAEAPQRELPCVVFAWIGQTWESCNDCGRPLREHLYHPPYGDQKPLFYVRQKGWRGNWVWRPVGSFVKRGGQQ